MEIVNEIFVTLQPYLITGITALVGYVVTKLKSKYDEKINTELKKEIITETVNYIQQVYEASSGSEKYDLAVATATAWLSEKNISISDIEIKILIESAIKTATETWNTSNTEAE